MIGVDRSGPRLVGWCFTTMEIHHRPAAAVAGFGESGRISRRPHIVIITHEGPIGGDPANCMIHTDLSGRQDGSRRQVTGRQFVEGAFGVTCLRFLTYGICHRNVVTADSDHLLT